MTAQEVGTLIAGPASAVVVCVLVLGALYRIVDRSILPLVARSVERHLAQVDLLLEQQRKESAALAKALGKPVSTVNYWFNKSKRIPYEEQHQLEVLTSRKLRADPVTVPERLA